MDARDRAQLSVDTPQKGIAVNMNVVRNRETIINRTRVGELGRQECSVYHRHGNSDQSATQNPSGQQSKTQHDDDQGKARVWMA